MTDSATGRRADGRGRRAWPSTRPLRRRRGRRSAVSSCATARSSGRGATGPFPGRARTPRSPRWPTPGDRARGATAYITLEPCDHDGNTPPCTRRTDRGGRSRGSWSRSRTPTRRSPAAASRGCAPRASRSRSAPARPRRGATSAPYLHHRRTGRPFAVLKTAMSLDGRTAAADGISQWITGPEARADAHRLRADRRRSSSGPATAMRRPSALTVRDARAGSVGPAASGAPRRARARPGRRSARRRTARAHAGRHHRRRAARRPREQWEAAGADGRDRRPGRRRSRRRSRCDVCGSSPSDHGVFQALVEGGGKLARRVRRRRPRGPARRLRRAGGARRAGPCGHRVPRARRRSTDADRRWRITDVDAVRPGRPDHLRTARPRSRGGGGGLMFTGIVEELGRVPIGHAERRTARASRSTRPRCSPTRASATRSRSTAAASPWSSSATARWAADAVTETLDRTILGVARRRRSGEPRAAGARRGPARRPPRAGPRRRRRPAGRHDRRCRTARPACASRCPTALLRYVVEKGSITLDGISLTVAALVDDAARGRRRGHPAHARRHHARAQGARRSRQRRGRRPRQVRRAPAPDEGIVPCSLTSRTPSPPSAAARS